MRGARWIGAACLCALAASCSRDGNAEAARDGAAPAIEQRAGAGETRLDPDSPQLQRIKVAAVETARVPLEEVTAPGRIQAIPTRVSRIAVPVPGRIGRIMVGLGDAVREGQPLFTLDSPEVTTLMAAYRQAEARAGQAKAELAKAEADLARVRELFEHRAIAQKEVIGAEAALAQAQAEAAQAAAAIQESLGRLDILGLKPGGYQQEITVRAPVSGKVLEISLASGEFRNDTSAPLMTIADLSSVYVAADVPESMIRLITVGERIDVRLAAFPGEEFSARVARIADAVSPETRTIQVIAELANPRGRLRPNMFGEIRHEETFETVPVVPREAVVQREGRTSVWREKAPGHFEAVDVKPGRPREGLVPVLAGIQAGDRLVVDGAMLLEGSN
ncbi:MAG: efflux RND transporter periplasmic adaptor subunit [Bryobacteraceae bacterium]|nr:efflux RND transporter periplasmic adaptor subunit [Bryobacteraceae bacterium]